MLVFCFFFPFPFFPSKLADGCTESKSIRGCLVNNRSREINVAYDLIDRLQILWLSWLLERQSPSNPTPFPVTKQPRSSKKVQSLLTWRTSVPFAWYTALIISLLLFSAVAVQYLVQYVPWERQPYGCLSSQHLLGCLSKLRLGALPSGSPTPSCCWASSRSTLSFCAQWMSASGAFHLGSVLHRVGVVLQVGLLLCTLMFFWHLEMKISGTVWFQGLPGLSYLSGCWIQAGLFYQGAACV